eukprot:UN22546
MQNNMIVFDAIIGNTTHANTNIIKIASSFVSATIVPIFRLSCNLFQFYFISHEIRRFVSRYP